MNLKAKTVGVVRELYFIKIKNSFIKYSVFKDSDKA